MVFHPSCDEKGWLESPIRRPLASYLGSPTTPYCRHETVFRLEERWARRKGYRDISSRLIQLPQDWMTAECEPDQKRASIDPPRNIATGPVGPTSGGRFFGDESVQCPPRSGARRRAE